MRNIVWMQHVQGSITMHSQQLAGLAGSLGEVDLVICDATDEMLEQARRLGASKVWHAKGDGWHVARARDMITHIVEMGDEEERFTVLAPNTADGSDLAGLVAAKLNCGIATDVVSINEKRQVAQHIFADTYEVLSSVSSDHAVFTVRPQVGTIPDISEICDVDTVMVSDRQITVEQTIQREDLGEENLAVTRLVVGAGRGVGSKEVFDELTRLAGLLGAQVGATKAVVEEGWATYAQLVGQTGFHLTSDLYIAFGVSGAIQHMAGVRSAKFIIAINSDSGAPIFQESDLVVVGDAKTIISALCEKLEEQK